MPKTIVLCSDGTGNADIKGRGTNVFKLFEAIDLNEHRTNPTFDTQLAYYDDGVGTKGSVILRALGGVAGYGLKANVKELYKELSRVYDSGDRVMLFGFSRGAFTVRTLAGMIGVCGVLKGEAFQSAAELRSAVEMAYDAYRDQYHSVATRMIGAVLGWKNSETALAEFRAKYRHNEAARNRLHDDVRIAFIGVWDTVDAVGMPFAAANLFNQWLYQFKFPTESLGAHVDRACHALSIDDPRLAFEPVLWKNDARIQQVWFAGVHSNVGGGYPKQGMSLVALDWMLAHAERGGLRLQKADRELFRGHATVDDLLYNPRARLGIFYRWGPRDIRRFCNDHKVKPCIHLSVAERIAHATDDYAPGNIPPGTTVVFTPADLNDEKREYKEALLAMRARSVEEALNRALGNAYLLDEMEPAVAKGERSYWSFVGSWVLVTLAVAFAVVPVLVRTTFPWRFAAIVAAVLSVAGFLLAWVLSLQADHSLEDRFSQFWQQHQRELREALKQSKAQAREPAH